MSYPTIKSILVLIGLLAALSVFLWQSYRRLWINLRRGQPGERFDQWGERLKGLLVYVAAQGRLFRFLIPGTSHFFIFWGFVLLFPTIAQAILEGLTAFTGTEYRLPLLGNWGPIALAQDLFTAFVIFAVLYALYIRAVVNPERYRGSHQGQGLMVLGFILTIMLSLLVMNGARINRGEAPLGTWQPVSRAVGGLFAGLGENVQWVIGEAAYWVHLGVVLIFLTELPRGKHFHIVTSLPAVSLRNLGPRGRLAPATEHSDDSGEMKPGVGSVVQFRWRQMLDFYTCTECGRCQEVCPAYASTRVLSPKLLIMRLREALEEHGRNGGRPPIYEVIGEESLWACTTCYACDQECPLFIEHIPPIVDMRRRLVFEGRMDDMLQEALEKLGRYGNSFGQSERMRARWAQALPFKIKDARREPVDYLWFTGDYAAYSATLTDITRKTAEVLHAAGLDFGLLYDAERNAGNDVRRVGEEGLFEVLAEKNLAALERCEYQAILTTDPHSYNTLKNEYPQLGNGHANGTKPVIHIAELLDSLIATGQLKLARRLDYTVTYHDPCYLGRYNNVYAAPRRVIVACGCHLVEMPRSRDRALCCGAGGGRIWMEERPGAERPSEARVREAAALPGVQAMVVACPKDVTMFKDAIKTTGLEDRLEIVDLVELVHQALQPVSRELEPTLPTGAAL
jgi:Fe-S oxidoreductase